MTIKNLKFLILVVCCACFGASLRIYAEAVIGVAESPSFKLIVDSGHPWRPPFGLERVGAPLQAHVQLDGIPDPATDYVLAELVDGIEKKRHSLRFSGEEAPYWATVILSTVPDEVLLVSEGPTGDDQEILVRKDVVVSGLEVDAVAHSNRLVNPVDLGAILVPHDWLLLERGQETVIEVAAISRTKGLPRGKIRAWFDGGEPVEIAFPLEKGMRKTRKLEVPFASSQEEDSLHVALIDDGRTHWKKTFRVMTVFDRPSWPEFGAVATKLRYDAPISVIDSSTGAVLPSLDYDTAWDSKLHDVVVSLPNGSRFVFWRGTNYVPFWAGKNNTGISYQWAENLSIPIHHPDGTRDFPEPLYDFELRYGSVEIIESTPSRVHVRWTYQATDVNYRVWGDQVREDFYFYPDGFGTRVVTISSKPGSRYQLSEFLILTPQSAFPLEVLPTHIADVLFLDGHKEMIRAPFVPEVNPDTGKPRKAWPDSRDQPAIFRIFAAKNDPAPAIYFYPDDKTLKLFSFTALHDRGQLVSPIYWGSHWPLGRGKITGWSVDDRIYSSPAHNSLGGWLPNPDGKGGWGNWEVRPIESGQFSMLNSLGDACVMDVNRWSWLIGKTEASDEELLRWAKSFSGPPSIEVRGADFDLPSYSPERRAIRLVVKSSEIEILMKPSSYTMNPVFELKGAAKDLHRIMLDGQILSEKMYAWDGYVLWVKTDVDANGAKLYLQFTDSGDDVK